MEQHKQLLRALVTGWISAIAVVILLATLTQVIIQFAISQEAVLRAASDNFAQEAQLSQNLERNSLFFLGPGNNDKVANEMQADLYALETRATYTKVNYRPLVPKLSTFPPSAKVTYNTVIKDVQSMIVVERKHLPEKAREKAIYPYITNMFYAQKDQLHNINLAQGYVNQTIDDYLAHISLTELGLYALNLLVWAFEGVFIWRLSRKLYVAFNEQEDAQTLLAGQTTGQII